MVPPATPLLEVRGLSKHFPGVRALHKARLTLAHGEVLAVIGENGAGKSTLMKILAGVQPADTGEILIDDHPIQFRNVRDALAQGVALIHQELNLAANLDLAANIFLGRELHQFGFINHTELQAQAAQYLQRVGLNLAPDTLVGDLPIGRQQLVEIAKALSCNARVLIMDEPTSSLSQHETETLFEVVHDLRAQGISVIYISHRLGEVKELADRVLVLRDGEIAGELSREEINHDAMVRLMVGRDLDQFYDRKQHDPGDLVLELEAVRTPAHPHCEISLQLRAGEIVGIAGLVGSGRTELLQTLFGVTPAVGGQMRVAGEPFAPRNPHEAIRAGLALAPEDRKQHGLILQMAVRENASLASLERDQKNGLLNFDAEETVATEAVEQLAIKTPTLDQATVYLSGGNQQKVVLGKWLTLKPRVLLLDEPTRGIDVGAKREIYRLMEQLAADGVAILFVSSEMEEVLGMADRALVMHEGRLAGELNRNQLSEESIMQLATGTALAA
ncbi:MAG: sugar ABC transporter ATP-binding protein [Verrucomicrobia subdivision 3 bacterium]|nr:sugar ABC transporter ATP-binding protein [Limisphaerales bacterium]